MTITTVTPDYLRNPIYKAVLESVEKVRELGYAPLYAANYGSHNYNLQINDDNYQSDIDTKVIVLPSLEDLVSNSKPISKTIDISTGECDIKDIRVFIQTLLKGNIQFLEILCAQVQWTNINYEKEVKWFQNNLETLIRGNSERLLKSIYGMSLEKQNALCHPYPTIKWKINKWGYDGKQLHHILRLSDFIKKYFLDFKTFKESIWYDNDTNKVMLLQAKKNEYPLDEALSLANIYCDLIKQRVDKLIITQKEDELIKNNFKTKSQEIIVNNIKRKILEENK